MWNQTYLHEFKSEGGDSLGYLPDYYLNFERKDLLSREGKRFTKP